MYKLNGIVNLTIEQTTEYIEEHKDNIRDVFYGKKSTIVYVHTGYDLIIDMVI